MDEGWVSTSVVDDGEPREIVADYLQQAEAAGLAPQGGAGCGTDGRIFTCGGFARTPDVADPRSLSVVVVRGTSDDVVSNHVVVTYSTTSLQWEHGGPFRAPRRADPPAPDPWPPLPGVGDGIGTAGETSHEVVVQEGSRMAGPSRLHLGDATGGVVAILEVTGDPAEVLAAFLEQLPDDQSLGRPEERTIGDAVVTTVHYSEAGGDQFRFTLVERPDRPTWLVVEGSHD